MKFAVCLLALGLPVAAIAQPKKLVNAQVDAQSAAAGLRAAFQAAVEAQPQPAWIGWTVPAARTRNFGCDGYWRESELTVAGGTVHLEPAAEVLVLVRVNNRQIGRIRTMALDCDIDAGGVPLHWLGEVKPAESVALLGSIASAGEAGGESAISAVALHADPAADALLESWLGDTHPDWLRRRAVYWLGWARGHRGFEAVRRVLASDAGDYLRERAVQSLARSEEPEVLDLLVSLARQDRSSKVRAQAVQALGRRDSPKAVTAIRFAVENDPERDVRRRAVSAFRELPNGAGVPLLIETARTARDAEVRKQAMNVLAQTHDSRATAFFESVLK